ncbi:MAG: hypothetical protein NTU41_14220, partial [Chloroflexi bacterium]|nr:hypothetical protein [Chloroflexota bacterium]
TLHMHIGSQISNPEDYAQALQSMIRVYATFKDKGFHVDTLDIGGGYPFRYLDRPQALAQAEGGAHAFSNYVGSDFEAYILLIKAVLRKHLGSSIPRLAIEPGRHLAAGAAFALGYVLNTKTYPNGIRWLISSVSVNDLFQKEITPATYYDIHVMTGGGAGSLPTGVGGTLCFSGDILTPPGVAVNLPDAVQRGERRCVQPAGYGELPQHAQAARLHDRCQGEPGGTASAGEAVLRGVAPASAAS